MRGPLQERFRRNPGDACSAEPYFALLRFHHTGGTEIGSDEIKAAVVDAPNFSHRGHIYVCVTELVLSDREGAALGK